MRKVTANASNSIGQNASQSLEIEDHKGETHLEMIIIMIMLIMIMIVVFNMLIMMIIMIMVMTVSKMVTSHQQVDEVDGQ